jgi:hypothetical protein
MGEDDDTVLRQRDSGVSEALTSTFPARYDSPEEGANKGADSGAPVDTHSISLVMHENDMFDLQTTQTLGRGAAPAHDIQRTQSGATMMTDVSNATRLTFSNGIGGSDQDGHGHTLIRGNLPSHTVRSRDLRASQDTINSVATLAEGVAGVKGSYKRQAPLSAAGPGQAGWRQSVDTNKSFSLAPTKEVVEVAAMYKVRNGGLVLSGALAVQWQLVGRW